MRRLRSLRVASTLALAACIPVSSPCGPTGREALAQADVLDGSGAKLSVVFVSLSETRGDTLAGILDVSLTRPSYTVPSPLTGHLKGVRLIDSSGRTLQNVEFGQSTETLVAVTRTIFVKDPTIVAATRDMLLKSSIAIAIDTDLPGLEAIRVRLPLKSAPDWARSRCD